MSMITTSIMEMFYRVSDPAHGLDKRVKETADFIFNFPFEWYSPTGQGKEEFKKLFVEHYFLNEIEFETVELFRLKLMEILSRKMPYYSQLYESTRLKYDPFITFDERTSGKGKSDNNVSRETSDGKESSVKVTEDTTKAGETAGESTNTVKDDKTSRNEYGETANTDNHNTYTIDTTQSTTGSDGEHGDNRQEHQYMIEGEDKTTNTNDTQNIHSENPQVTIGTKDYASTMERGHGLTDAYNRKSSEDKGENHTVNSITKTSVANSTSTGKNFDELDEDFSKEGHSDTVDTGTQTANGNTSGTSKETGNRIQSTGAEETATSDMSEKANSTHEESGHRRGFNEPNQSLLLKYRETFLNLNEMLLMDCAGLFCKIYKSGYEARTGGEYYGIWV